MTMAMSRGSRAQTGRSEPPQPGMSGTATRCPAAASCSWKGSQPGLPQLWWRTTIGLPALSPLSPVASSSLILPVASGISRSA